MVDAAIENKGKGGRCCVRWGTQRAPVLLGIFFFSFFKDSFIEVYGQRLWNPLISGVPFDGFWYIIL